MKFKFSFFVFCLNILAYQVCYGQENQESLDKSDPYELMSKYYEEDFNPFSKGNWYVGFAFSLKDQKLQNQYRLFDKVLDGQDLNYDLTFKGGYFISDFNPTWPYRLVCSR